jgi:hypothetical protein
MPETPIKVQHMILVSVPRLAFGSMSAIDPSAE